MTTKERNVFTNNYGDLCNIFKTEDSLLDKFVEKKIISADQAMEIRGTPITRKSQVFLMNISGPLEAGQTNGFYIMLEIMKIHGKLGTNQLAMKIEQQVRGRTDGAAINEDHLNGGSEKTTDLYKDAYRPNQDPMFSDEYLEKKYKNAKTANEVMLFNELSPEQNEICHAVQAMIINVNERELMATMSYLEPPNESYTTVLEVHRKIIIGHNPETAIFHIGMFGKCLVAVVRVEAGCAKVAINQTDLFPNIVLIAAVGVAAGFPENGVKIGDVLVSERITDCSKYKYQDDAYIHRGTTFRACAYMMQRLKSNLRWEFQCSNTADNNKSKVKFGHFLSKPVLLDDPAERGKILKYFGIEAKGYEMEGFELFGKINCIIIKGVCDLAGGKTKKWQSTAALAANDYLYHHLNKSDLALQNDKPEGCKHDGPQQPMPEHVQPKENAKPEDHGPKQPVLVHVGAKNTGSYGEDQMEESDGLGLKQHNDAKLNANKHNDMIADLAERLCNDDVNYRRLYRYFGLDDKQKKMVEENPTKRERTYETLAQYVESKKPMVDELIEILKKCKCDQSHIEFVAHYNY